MKKIMTWIIVIGLSLTTLNTFAETYYDAYSKEYKPTAEETRALKTAKGVCEKEGWEWKDVSIASYGNECHVSTKCMQYGGNAVITIHKETGEVISKFFNGK